jgi:hypothetical protein
LPEHRPKLIKISQITIGATTGNDLSMRRHRTLQLPAYLPIFTQ